MAVPKRLEWAVELLDVRLADRILEIGCGGGVAAGLIDGAGFYTGIDRSATQITRARKRLPGLRFEIAEIGDHSPAERYTKVFAVNVNLFWTRSPARELKVIGEVLEPGGCLLLVYETPGGAGGVGERVARAFAGHGWAASLLKDEGLVAIRAHPPATGSPGP